MKKTVNKSQGIELCPRKLDLPWKPQLEKLTFPPITVHCVQGKTSSSNPGQNAMCLFAVLLPWSTLTASKKQINNQHNPLKLLYSITSKAEQFSISVKSCSGVISAIFVTFSFAALWSLSFSAPLCSSSHLHKTWKSDLRGRVHPPPPPTPPQSLQHPLLLVKCCDFHYPNPRCNRSSRSLFAFLILSYCALFMVQPSQVFTITISLFFGNFFFYSELYMTDSDILKTLSNLSK